MAEKDVDEQFAAIMAHWDEEALGLDPFGDPTAAAEPAAAEPAQPPAPDGRSGPPPPPAPAGPRVPIFPPVPPALAPPAPPASQGPPEPLDVDGDGDVDGEHFEPPPPAPLPPPEDKHFWTMLGALVGGPLLFLYLLLFNRDGNGWWMTFALLVSVAGFVLLVLRQPVDRDEDDDGIRL